MKVCFISAYNLKIYPLTSIYTSFFEKYDITYDVIYADRIGVKECSSAEKMYRFNYKYKAKTCKVYNFIMYKTTMARFRKFAKKIIRKNKYDFIILWGEEVAYFFADYVGYAYRGRYSVNIRDLWDMTNERYNAKIKQAVSYSSFNTVSSDGFIAYLPKAKYLFVHSANEEVVSSLSPEISDTKIEPIVIESIGTFRNDEYNYSVLDKFANDSRFLLKFVGPGSERIDAYCVEKGYKNVQCMGEFKLEETASLLEGASILNCAYGSDNDAERAKLPIRFYYAVYKTVPVLTSSGTQIERYAKQLGMDICIPEDVEDIVDLADGVYRQYMGIDTQQMRCLIEQFKCEIVRSHKELEKVFCNANKIQYRE